MKTSLKVLTAVLGALALASCASAPQPVSSSLASKVLNPNAPVFIEHQGTLMGDEAPMWINEDISDLEKEAKYKGKVLFRAEATAENQTSAKLLAERMNADVELARMISLRVKSLFSGATVGDDKALETYMEETVKSLSETQISNYKKEGSFWVKFETPATKKIQFRYYVLYSIPQDYLKEMIVSQNAPKTPEDTKAQARVKELVTGSALPGLSSADSAVR